MRSYGAGFNQTTGLNHQAGKPTNTNQPIELMKKLSGDQIEIDFDTIEKDGTPRSQPCEGKVIEDIAQRYAKIILYP